MGKPTSGPDWIDIEAMMRALASLHSGLVGVSVFASGTGFSGGLNVAVAITFDVLPGSALPEEVIVNRGWPCNEHRDLTSHIFALLHELDFEISKVYKNETLWK